MGPDWNPSDVIGGEGMMSIVHLPAVDERTSDATLVERSLRDPEAFAGLFDRHAAEIHRYAARRLGSAVANSGGSSSPRASP